MVALVCWRGTRAVPGKPRNLLASRLRVSPQSRLKAFTALGSMFQAQLKPSHPRRTLSGEKKRNHHKKRNQNKMNGMIYTRLQFAENKTNIKRVKRTSSPAKSFNPSRKLSTRSLLSTRALFPFLFSASFFLVFWKGRHTRPVMVLSRKGSSRILFLARANLFASVICSFALTLSILRARGL